MIVIVCASRCLKFVGSDCDCKAKMNTDFEPKPTPLFDASIDRNLLHSSSDFDAATSLTTPTSENMSMLESFDAVEVELPPNLPVDQSPDAPPPKEDAVDGGEKAQNSDLLSSSTGSSAKDSKSAKSRTISQSGTSTTTAIMTTALASTRRPLSKRDRFNFFAMGCICMLLLCIQMYFFIMAFKREKSYAEKEKNDAAYLKRLTELKEENECRFLLRRAYWSPCTKTCDKGVRFREVKIQGCDVREETTCNDYNCSSAEWKEWSNCDCKHKDFPRVRIRKLSENVLIKGPLLELDPCNWKSATKCSKTDCSGGKFKVEWSVNETALCKDQYDYDGEYTDWGACSNNNRQRTLTDNSGVTVGIQKESCTTTTTTTTTTKKPT